MSRTDLGRLDSPAADPFVFVREETDEEEEDDEQKDDDQDDNNEDGDDGYSE